MTGSLLRDFAAEQGFPLDDFQVEACLAVEGGRECSSPPHRGR